MKNKGFTLVELLVIVAIISVLATAGVIAYNSYTLDAKKQATIAKWKSAASFIENTFLQCKLRGSNSTIILSSRSNLQINCATVSTDNPSIATINSLGDTFTAYFLEAGYKNPYDPTAVNSDIIVRRGSGGTPLGGLRLDWTECTTNRSKYVMTLWYKVHDQNEDYTRLLTHNWC
jgi:prepilin-type N-terminal cleavage/methylation domain-containing protein